MQVSIQLPDAKKKKKKENENHTYLYITMWRLIPTTQLEKKERQWQKKVQVKEPTLGSVSPTNSLYFFSLLKEKNNINYYDLWGKEKT